MNQKKLTVILGTAHGKNVAGKRSPDGKFQEWQYSREIIGQLKSKLELAGLNVFVDNMESEVPLPANAELRARCKYVNDLCDKYSTKNCAYVSIHVNAAASTGSWNKAGGWAAYTSPGRTRSDILATYLYEAAEKHLSGYAAKMEEDKKKGLYGSNQKPFRKDLSDGDPDKEANFYVLTRTKCAAVLTENLFMDNKADVAFLQSEDGRKAIVALHKEAIMRFAEHNI